MEDGESFYRSVEATATVFQAEIEAIKQCAINLSDKNYTSRNIIIASDSKSALQALNNYKVTSFQIWACIQVLNLIGKKNEVQLLWVPGHSGIFGNEMADELANLVSAEERES